MVCFGLVVVDFIHIPQGYFTGTIAPALVEQFWRKWVNSDVQWELWYKSLKIILKLRVVIMPIFVDTDGTKGFHNINLAGHQWQQSMYHGDSQSSGYIKSIISMLYGP